MRRVPYPVPAGPTGERIENGAKMLFLYLTKFLKMAERHGFKLLETYILGF